MGIPLYPRSVYERDLSPEFASSVSDICEEIEAACKGFGTNEARLLKVMGGMKPETRCKVPIRYKELFGKDLKSVMKSECGNREFGTALQFLALPPDVAECEMIEAACKGPGTKKLILSSIIGGRTNDEIEILKKSYFEIHSKDLSLSMHDELGGEFEDFVVNCLQGVEQDFDPDFHTDDKVKEDVAAFFQMGQGRWGTNEKGLFKLICSSPSAHLNVINKAYAEEHGYTLYKVMEKELAGDVGRATLFSLGMKLKPYDTVAKLIHEAVEGFGTNEFLLTSILIRYQPIMKAVKESYTRLYGKRLEDVVKDETNGDYEKLMLEVLHTADHL